MPYFIIPFFFSLIDYNTIMDDLKINIHGGRKMLEYLASSIARDMLIIIGLGIATNVGKQIKYKIQKRGR